MNIIIYKQYVHKHLKMTDSIANLGQSSLDMIAINGSTFT